MTYPDRLNATLQPTPHGAPLVLDLFAGCGGLALGFEAKGFATHGFEQDANSSQTYRANLHGGCDTVTLTPHFAFPPADVVMGGPPCQPFSVGGGQRGLHDARDGFPTFIQAIAQAQPDIWLFENVRGLMYRNRWYLDEIVDSLRQLGYLVEWKLLNAVQYGVPQNRERLIVVGHRGRFTFPEPLPGRVTAGEALGELATAIPPESRFLTESMDTYVAKYERASHCKVPRDLHLDRPSRTLTCRNLAGATGDMMRVLLPDGRRRRLVAQEAARLQSFPDWYQFTGPESSVFNQIGNAVPPLLAYHLAASVRAYLASPFRLTPEEVQAQNNQVPAQLDLFSTVGAT
jgi:DNA (cytosine-5)-methyltransferase 1